MHPVVEELIKNEYAAQKSDEWLALRGKMLTCSELAACLNMNPYENETSLLLKKCGHNKFFGNEATKHGEKYEDVARDIYCAQYGEKTHEIGLHPHPIHKWLGGSPDGVTESGKLIEIKCPMMRKITPEIPEHYLPQVQVLMEILNLEECDFIQYKPLDLTWPAPAEFVMTNVKRDRIWFAEKLPIMDAFWKRVLFHREHGQLADLIQASLPKIKTKRKILPPPSVCRIEYDPDDDIDPYDL